MWIKILIYFFFNFYRTSNPREPFETIRISGLTPNVIREHIEEIFGAYGEIINCNFPVNNITKLNTGFCIVTYKSSDFARNAFEELNEVLFFSSSIE